MAVTQGTPCFGRFCSCEADRILINRFARKRSGDGFLPTTFKTESSWKTASKNPAGALQFVLWWDLLAFCAWLISLAVSDPKSRMTVSGSVGLKTRAVVVLSPVHVAPMKKDVGSPPHSLSMLI
jgi:hypothetical protein